MIAGNFLWQTGRGSLHDYLSPAEIAHLKDKFFSHILGSIAQKWHWFPLNSISGQDYRGENLLLLDLPEAVRFSQQDIRGFLERHPIKSAGKYTGVRARNVEHAKEKLGILLGAFFLCMHSGTHYLHTMGKPATGLLFFDDQMTLTSSRPHLPYLACGIQITQDDFPLFSKLNDLLKEAPKDRKIIRSLRWLSSSWFASGAEKLSLICQAMDALTPSKLKMMKEKCDWIYTQLDGATSQASIEMIFKKIRSDIAHGDAPSLIESPTYLEFLSRYNVDPELASVEILRKVLVDRFLPQVVIRNHPALEIPDYLDHQTQIFARYGIEFSLPTGFDFSKVINIEPHFRFEVLDQTFPASHDP